jgi:hypothetical protein
LGAEKIISDVAVETFAVPGRGIAKSGGACGPLQACAGEAKSVAHAKAPPTMKIDFIEHLETEDAGWLAFIMGPSVLIEQEAVQAFESRLGTPAGIQSLSNFKSLTSSAHTVRSVSLAR